MRNINQYLLSCIFLSVQALADELTLTPVNLQSGELSQLSSLLQLRMNPLTTADYELLAVNKAKLSGRDGLIVCVKADKQRFSYSGPYAFMVTGKRMVNLGGNDFCKLAPGSYRYREYSLKRAGNLKLSKSDRKKIPAGKVIIEHSISKRGLVENIRVLDNSSRSQRAVKVVSRAMKKYRYLPRKIAGNHVDVHGVRQSFSFYLVEVRS